jgi:hypothetical protein
MDKQKSKVTNEEHEKKESVTHTFKVNQVSSSIPRHIAMHSALYTEVDFLISLNVYQNYILKNGMC